MSQRSKPGRGKTVPPAKGNAKSSSQKKTAHSSKPQYRLFPEGSVHADDTAKYDCCAYIIHCADHDSVLLTKQRDSRWMPFVFLPPNRSWEESGLAGVARILVGKDPNKQRALLEAAPHQIFHCLQLARLQMPQSFKFIKRLTFYLKLKTSSGIFKCCQPVSSNLEWFPLKEICDNKVPGLWGPELVQFCRLINSPDRSPFRYKIVEYSLEEAFYYLPRKPARNLEESLLNTVGITFQYIERLYEDFLEFCFPSFCMSFYVFKHYLATKHELEKDPARLERLFLAFNVSNSGWLTFPELLMGLACLDPNSYHGELRCKFIFRCWDTQHRGALNEAQVKGMLSEVCSGEQQVNSKMAELLSVTGGTLPLSEQAFINAVGSLKFRGTSGICRSSKAIFAQLSRDIVLKHWNSRRKSERTVQKALGKVLLNRRHGGQCEACQEKKYHLASHLVLFDIEGRLVSRRLSEVALAEPTVEKKVVSSQQYSIECVFKESHVAHCMINLVRAFNAVKGTAAEPNGLMAKQPEQFWELLLHLSNDVSLLLEEEVKCQRVYSPCFIIGDIHGNIEDLLSMERALWKQLPCLGANYLFLGDYVDRGQWGLECALYLIAMKVICPNKVTLLRGNHEVRSLQANYTYKKECILKYGAAFGLKVWELSNRIFDVLPVCALVDEVIFCAHGGIPHAGKTIQEIISVPRQICEPSEESLITWEILWSDPCGLQEYQDTCEIVGVDPETQAGWVYNNKRNTAFKFSELAAKGFFKANLLTHIIRSHEVAEDGFQFNYPGTTCITIFSSSHYCGNSNKCGFILADNQRCRVCLLDTSANGPATD